MKFIMKTDPVKLSEEYFKSGFGCAESVLMAIAVSQNIKSELIPRIASGFCGGVSHTGGMCGALTGGIMALNIIYGRDTVAQSKELNYQKVQEFVHAFKSRYGTMNCSELTGCDLGTEKGMAQFSFLNKHEKCTELTAEATRMALELIDD
jgi:C_GCAxxG_C_C family probable redox protein